MMRTRQDVADLTLGDATAAATKDWHPVLDTYARGIELMRAREETDPRSWLWAANTHGSPPGTDPRPAWNACAHGSLFFLPWHRAYLAWFESTIRALTEQDDWALPYWDYAVPGDEPDRLLPAEFTVETRTVDGEVVPNPLFDAARDLAALDPVNVDIVPALSEARFVRAFPMPGFGGVDRDGFPGWLEHLPHNFVHGDISGLMGRTTTAGRDPVFWLHHANIDRLWEVWRGLPGSIGLLDDEDTPALLVSRWRSAIFWFGPERQPEQFTMDQVEDLDALGYGYASVDLPPEVATAVQDARSEAAAAGGRRGLDDTEPGWAPVAATFDLASGEQREVPLRGGRGRGLDSTAPAGLVLELAGVRAIDPHAVYVVEVRSAPDAEPHLAGRFSTFGLDGTPDTEERSYLVDASPVLGALVDEGWSGTELSVRVVPEPGAVDADDPAKGVQVRQVTVYAQVP